MEHALGALVGPNLRNSAADASGRPGVHLEASNNRLLGRSSFFLVKKYVFGSMRSQLGAGEFLKLCSGLSAVHIYASQQHTSISCKIQSPYYSLQEIEFLEHASEVLGFQGASRRGPEAGRSAQKES